MNNFKPMNNFVTRSTVGRRHAGFRSQRIHRRHLRQRATASSPVARDGWISNTRYTPRARSLSASPRDLRNARDSRPRLQLAFRHIAGLVVEQPEKLDLVVKLKIAKALGIEMPGSILARADEVIE